MANSTFGWRYYNHAAIPACEPHEKVNEEPLVDGSIWIIDGKKPLFARWISNWDCKKDTGWWYVIKDTPFDITVLKTKRRYEITKALRFCEVREINPVDYADALLVVQIDSFSAYAERSRPEVDIGKFRKKLDDWAVLAHLGKIRVFGAFFKDSGELIGYSMVSIQDRSIDFTVQKTKPQFEKFNVNAALVYSVLDSFRSLLEKGFYICDGSRCINHETHFQEYLEKYFCFRKAFCLLHIVYRAPLATIVNILYPFRSFFASLGRFVGLFHLLSSVLKMEEIARRCKKIEL